MRRPEITREYLCAGGPMDGEVVAVRHANRWRCPSKVNTADLIGPGNPKFEFAPPDTEYKEQLVGDSVRPAWGFWTPVDMTVDELLARLAASYQIKVARR